MDMIDGMIQEGVQKLLKTERRVYIVASGAGAGLQKLFWEVPGVSKVLVGAEFPYDTVATNRFLGFTPDQGYCSPRTAIQMAMEAYYRALPGPTEVNARPAIGVGLTASVASVGEHKGDHRVHVATVSEEGVWVHTTILPKGTGVTARRRDGNICDELGLEALLHAADITIRIHPFGIMPASQECSAEAMQILLAHPLFTANGKRASERWLFGCGVRTIFPGAFNPPHESHLWMADVVGGATFQITVDPPHKPALTVAQVLQRARLLEGRDRLFSSGDPLYIDKARRFPESWFLIGFDAFERMLDPKWGVPVDVLFEEFRKLGVKFHVADRDVDGFVCTLDEAKNVPHDIFSRLPVPPCYLGMSSTKIRESIATSK